MLSDFQSKVHSNFPMNSSTFSEDFRPMLTSTSIQNPTFYLLDLTDDPTPPQHFHNSTIRGCMFHFNPAQMRRFQKIPDSTSDEVIQVLLSSIYGLHFLPIGDVLDAWTELKTRICILYPPLPSQTTSLTRRRPGSSPPPTPSPCGTSLQQWSTMSPGPTTLQKEGTTL